MHIHLQKKGHQLPQLNLQDQDNQDDGEPSETFCDLTWKNHHAHAHLQQLRFGSVEGGDKGHVHH